MNRRDVLKLTAAFATFSCESGSALGQNSWAPDAPVKFVVPTAPGGPLDYYARTVGGVLGTRLGKPVVPDFRPGAGQAIGGDIVHRSPPNGQTIFIMSTSFMLNALLTPVPFDPLKGFTPVIELAGNEIFVMVNADKFKFRTPQGFIDWAKENGNKAYYGLPNSGGGGQMVAELINKRAGVSLQPVVYKGSAPMMTDLLGGQIGLVVETFATVKPFLESGKIKIIACCSSTRSQFQPDVPTLAETVLPGFDLPAWFGILAPPNTPRQIVDRYNREINEVLKDTAVIDSFARYGTRVTGGTTEAFERFLTETHGLYKQIISEAKLAPG